MSRDLLIAAAPGEFWAAVCDEDELVDLRLFRGAARSRVGQVYLGRVVGLEPALPAALVEIGLSRPAFLGGEDARPGTGIAELREGEAVVVQVKKDARADKAAGVTLRPRLAGRFLDLTPARPGIAIARGPDDTERQRLLAALAPSVAAGEGFLIRAEAADAAAEDLAVDAGALRARWQAIETARARLRPPARLEAPAPLLAALLAALLDPGPAPERIVIDDRAAYAEARGYLSRHRPDLVPRLEIHAASEPLFEHEGIAAEIDAVLAPRVALPGGGALIIETTAAAVTIDVDSGGGPIIETNLAAAREAARQIRMRNLAGPMIVDFIAMKHRGDRDRVAAAFQEALGNDADAAQLLGWTRLGHMELVRARRAAALAELLYERGERGGLVKTALTVALEALRAASREAMANPGSPLVLRVEPRVASSLAEGEAQEALRGLEARLGRKLTVAAEPGRARESFDVAPGDIAPN